MRRSLAVVKVGGSLYDLPDLGPRLRAWLRREDVPWSEVLLVPGGGPTVDVIRDLDRIHQLGEERAHWLALDALRLNAAFLETLLSMTGTVTSHPEDLLIAEISDSDAWGTRASVLDPKSFALWVERVYPEARLPPSWAVTSDSIAARAAVVYDADYLVLLKSVTIPHEIDWDEAARLGFVDEWFASSLRSVKSGLHVQSINFREWHPG